MAIVGRKFSVPMSNDTNSKHIWVDCYDIHHDDRFKRVNCDLLCICNDFVDSQWCILQSLVLPIDIFEEIRNFEG